MRRKLTATSLFLPALRPHLHRCCLFATQALREIVSDAFAESVQVGLDGGEVAVVVVPDEVRQLASAQRERAEEGPDAHVVGLVNRDVQTVVVNVEGKYRRHR